jgi:hypothetical protein
MDLIIVLTVVAACGGAVSFGILLRKLASGPRTLPVTAEWIDDLSVERYRPMLRLLSEEDLRFLSSQPGYTRQMARQFRAQRCQIFRGYLRWLQSDFQRVCTAIRVLMLQSSHDRPDLATILLRQKALFAMGMVSIQFRLLLYRWGWSGVEVDGVMAAFDSLRLELRQLVPAAAGVEA